MEGTTTTSSVRDFLADPAIRLPVGGGVAAWEQDEVVGAGAGRSSNANAIDLTLDDDDDDESVEGAGVNRQEQQPPHVPAPAQASSSTAPLQPLLPRPAAVGDNQFLDAAQMRRAQHLQKAYQDVLNQCNGGGGGGGGSGSGQSTTMLSAATPNQHLRVKHQAFLEEQEQARLQALQQQRVKMPPPIAPGGRPPATMLTAPSAYGNPLVGARPGYPSYASQFISQHGPVVSGGGAAYGGGGNGGNGTSGTPHQYSERPRYDEQAPSIEFAVSSGREFSAKIIGNMPQTVITHFGLAPGARRSTKRKRWYFPLAVHNILRVALEKVRREVYRDTGVIISLSPIPDEVLRQLSIHKDGEVEENTTAQKEAHEKLAGLLPKRLLETLAPFQKEGVAFVVGREGRGLIADEMGLGKTVQAIAVAAAYKEEWPLLVMCPSSARFHWEAELVKWLDEDLLKPEQVQVVTAGKEKLLSTSKVVILSYDLALRLKDELRRPRKVVDPNSGVRRKDPRFKVVVADECHYLKNASAQRTRELLPLLAEAKRAILLSGTPALSRPRELWTQLSVLNGETWNDQSSFLDRYCTGGRGGGKRNWKGRGQGAANLRELHEMLKATVMVRRRKKDILKGLPPKRRIFHKVAVPQPELRARLEQAMEDLSTMTARGKKAKEGSKKKKVRREEDEDLCSAIHRQRQEQHQQQQQEQQRERAALGFGGAFYGNGGGGGGGGGGGMGMASSSAAVVAGEGEEDEWTARQIQQQKKMILMEVFKLTGTAKIPLAVDRIAELLASDLSGKVLVFAHHRNVLDGIEQQALRGVPHIRIDGSTNPRERHSQVQTFQTDPSVRVALLSITAAGLALTLTAASRAIFVELFWTPGALLQAEDRCHRIGQTSEVEIEYLLAQDTLDDVLWPLIQRKMRVLGELVEGTEGMNMIEKDSKREKDEEEDLGGAEAEGRNHEDEEEEEEEDSESSFSASSSDSSVSSGGEDKKKKAKNKKRRRRKKKKVVVVGEAGGGKISAEGETKKRVDEGQGGFMSERSRQLLQQLAREDRDRGDAMDEDEEEEEQQEELDWESSGLDDSGSSSEDDCNDVCELVTIHDDDDEKEENGRSGDNGQKGSAQVSPPCTTVTTEDGKELIILDDDDDEDEEEGEGGADGEETEDEEIL